jgi:hypothetical protein
MADLSSTNSVTVIPRVRGGASNNIEVIKMMPMNNEPRVYTF